MVDLELFVIIFVIQTAQTKALLEKFICEPATSNIDCTETPCSTLNITYANFGRTSLEKCSHSNGNATDCSSSNSTAVVRDICQEKVICTLGANNSIFGDPCSGVSKYLEVHFECTDTESCSTASESTRVSSSTSATTGVLPVVSSVTTNQIPVSTDSYSETTTDMAQSRKISSVSSEIVPAGQTMSSYIITTIKLLVTKKTTTSLTVGILDTSAESSAKTAFVEATSSPPSSTSTTTKATTPSSSVFFDDPRHIAIVAAVAGVVIIGTAAASAYAYFSHGGMLSCATNNR